MFEVKERNLIKTFASLLEDNTSVQLKFELSGAGSLLKMDLTPSSGVRFSDWLGSGLLHG
jgi:hypothetical protein